MQTALEVVVLGILSIVLGWIWTQYLPGYFLSRALVPGLQGYARHGLALVCGFSTVPLVIFLATVWLEIPMDAPVILGAATVINAVGFATVVRGAGGLRSSRGLFPDIQWTEVATLAVAWLVIALYILFGLRSLDGGDVFSTVHHCLYVIVMHTIGNDATHSLPLYDGISDQPIHYLVQHPTVNFNGLASLFYEQRLGNAPILAPAVALFGTAGWYLTTVSASLIVGLCTWLAARELGARPAAATFSAALFVYGTHVFLAYFVNENLYAVALVAFLLWLALRSRMEWGVVVLVGITAGHLVGVRYTSSLFWPAIAASVFWQQGHTRDRFLRFGVAFALALAAVAPWLYVNYIMLGHPIDHPKIHEESTGRVAMNTFLGVSFSFRPLNWPFTDAIVRTAWNPLPSFLWIPLWVGVCFGQLALALSLLGARDVLRQRRALFLLLLFAVPHCFAMGLLEWLDWEQVTYAVPGLVPLAVLWAVGLEGVLDPSRGRKQAMLCLVLLLGIGGLSRAGRSLEFPVDTRLLEPEHWQDPPPMDAGTKSVGDRLMSLSVFPPRPIFRTTFARSALGSFAHAGLQPALPLVGDLPAYPSGQVALLAGYAAEEASRYRFAMEGGDLRKPDEPIRTSLGLHLVSLQLPAESVEVSILWRQGSYDINIVPVGESVGLKDFSFWLHPWYPPTRIIRVKQGGEAIPSLRVLEYGGSRDEGERRYMVTNYPEDRLDVVTLPYRVEPGDEPVYCGLFLFSYGVEPDRIETLVLSGGHDQSWDGSLTGTITLPQNILADKLVLFAEPYCSDHVPQYGDRYSVIEGPFVDGQLLEFRLDRHW
ncbi:MAG: hypothetical protein CL928_14260 [Deltaproteobacteria bacterium]|nr:hypothetical protein [Deltaproteobacteria bacterium]